VGKPSLDATERDDPLRCAINDFVRKAAAGVPEGARVLDAGAGECIYRPLFAGRRYIGVDRAVGDGTWDYGRLDALADLGRLPFSTASFDWIFCTETLEHLLKPRQALSELGRVLKSGGRLVLTVPFLQAIHQEPHDYFRYTPNGLCLLLAEAGFGEIQLETAGGYFALLDDQLRDLPAHLPLGIAASPRTWISWPARAVARASALAIRWVASVLRHREPPGPRPLQVFVQARRIA
jgi:SAM-dependent methyltransferase